MEKYRIACSVLDKNKIRNLVFSVGDVWCTSGAYVNNQNDRCWCYENPHAFDEASIPVIACRIIGPVFYSNCCVNSDTASEGVNARTESAGQSVFCAGIEKQYYSSRGPSCVEKY